VTVVGLVEIDTVPACLKMKLGTQATSAGRVCEHVGGFWIDGVGDTEKAHSILDRPVWIGCISPSHAGLVVSTNGFVARKHFEAFGERGGGGGSVLEHTSSEIVNDASTMRHFFEGTIGVLVVEQWCPVSRLIGGDFAGIALGVQQTLVSCVDTDIWSIVSTTRSTGVTCRITYLIHRR